MGLQHRRLQALMRLSMTLRELAKTIEGVKSDTVPSTTKKVAGGVG